ncbi:MAG: hypothetical protein OEY59_10575, partial [Deltaproteobacteria bacterium]|nr:hypothetical protein [Deltaproteobacteria bacterium]
MKNYLLILTVLSAVIFMGCNQSNSGDSNGIYVTEKCETDWYNDGVIEQSYYFSYDANGNMIKQEQDTSNDGTVDWIWYFSYDTQGNMIRQEEDWDNDGIIEYAYILHYD